MNEITNSMSRRKFIAIAGGGVVVAAGLGIGANAMRTPTNALKPWQRAGSDYQEPRKRALSYAILAPNPHNRQPWKVDLSSPNTVVLSVDTDRLLPHTDPFNRQITIGLGCFLEVMAMAAAENGYKVDFELFPEGHNDKALDKRPVAICNFQADENVTPDPLFAHVLKRQSLKEPYDLMRLVEAEKLAAIANVGKHSTGIGTNNDKAAVEKMRKITTDAMRLEIETPRTYQESIDLFRIGTAEIEANPDGIDFSGPLFETLGLFGLMSREGVKEKGSTQYEQGVAAVLENTETAMAHIWQVTQTNTRLDQIATGRDWVRINLAATAHGLGIQPLSQALQEYPEMQAHYKQVHDLLAPKGGTVQMLARLGYGERVAQSPRWPLEAKIIG